MNNKKNRFDFLPVCREDMDARGWSELDFLCVIGDAYVDHPSFGGAIISRLLESLGYRVGVIAQPDWRSADDFARMGRPRYAAFVAAGNLDSMLANYSSPDKKRRKDAYSPNGQPGKRPDRATIVYCNRIRERFGDIPVVIGGIEASLRRTAHYDYWSDSVRRSILTDSRADLLIYGMAERQIEAVAPRLVSGENIRDMRDIAGTCWKTHNPEGAQDAVKLPSFGEVADDKRTFAEAFRIFYAEQSFAGRRLIQDNGAWHVVHNPPPRPLSRDELDRIYELPYARMPHPSYDGDVPAFAEVNFSITSHRGCFGECSFCALSQHQGRVIQSRSAAGIEREARLLTSLPGFKGYISDVGGPTANFIGGSCKKSVTDGPCKGKSCLFPKPCKFLPADHGEFIALLRRLRAIPGVKKVFLRSGLRYDYIMADPNGEEFIGELCRYHVSGQLKIAPEHAAPSVLALMRKPSAEAAERFIGAYKEANRRLGKAQFLVPYFMSAHPGCGLGEALELALFMKKLNARPEQAQEFTPTPGTVSTCMYHTGIDPFTGKNVYVAKEREEKKLQRALLQYWMPENRALVGKALKKLGKANLMI
ncbi:UPF0313 protein [Synergistales bacterium]|nr:UPF0313 protein [Synergistales bacterium]